MTASRSTPPSPAQSAADALRVLRAVEPPHAPLAGHLVRSGERVLFAVPLHRLAGWPGWSASSPHVWGAIDVAIDPFAGQPSEPAARRRWLEDPGEPDPNGTLVLLPRAVAPLEAVLRSAGGSLRPGVVVTAVVSIVRGWGSLRAASLDSGESEPDGRWWVTDDGVPVYVARPRDLASGHRDAASRECGEQLLRIRAQAASTAGLIDAVLDRVDAGDFAGAESVAFGWSPPEPLDVGPFCGATDGAAQMVEDGPLAHGRWDGVEGVGVTSGGPPRRRSWEALLDPDDGPDAEAEWGSDRNRASGGRRRSERGPAARGSRPTAGARAFTRLTTAAKKALARHVDPDLAETVNEAALTWDVGGGRGDTSARPADRDPSRGRAGQMAVAQTASEPRKKRRTGPLLAGAAAVAVVAGVGLLWPAGDDGATARTGSVVESAPSAAAGSATDAVAGPETADPAQGSTAPPATTSDGAAASTDTTTADPQTAAEALMSAWSACSHTCGSDVLIDASAGWPEGASWLAPASRTTTLLDDLGSAAVIRVDAASSTGDAPAASQHLVITRTGAGWRVSSVRSAQG